MSRCANLRKPYRIYSGPADLGNSQVLSVLLGGFQGHWARTEPGKTLGWNGEDATELCRPVAKGVSARLGSCWRPRRGFPSPFPSCKCQSQPFSSRLGSSCREGVRLPDLNEMTQDWLVKFLPQSRMWVFKKMLHFLYPEFCRVNDKTMSRAKKQIFKAVAPDFPIKMAEWAHEFTSLLSQRQRESIPLAVLEYDHVVSTFIRLPQSPLLWSSGFSELFRTHGMKNCTGSQRSNCYLGNRYSGGWLKFITLEV